MHVSWVARLPLQHVPKILVMLGKSLVAFSQSRDLENPEDPLESGKCHNVMTGSGGCTGQACGKSDTVLSSIALK